MSQQLPLSQDQFALVDDEDFARFSRFHWTYRPERNGKQGYAIRTVKVDGKWKKEYLHRLIMQPPAGKTVIFQNHDTLDCRRANLKVVTTQEARRQHRVRSDNPTGLKGISYNPGPKTWNVDIWRGRERKRVGTFLTQREAMDAYEAAVQWVKTDLFSRTICDAGMIGG